MSKASFHISIITGLLFAAFLFSTACKDNNDPEPQPGLKAAFSASPFEGHSPLAVEFKDESTGSPTSWKWDLQGDGSYETFEKNPSYTYDEPGFYDVRLLVSDGNRSDSTKVFNYIYLKRDDVQLNYTGTLSPNVDESLEIPVKIDLDVEFGAMTIKLFYDNRILEITSIEGDMEGYVSNIAHQDGSVLLAWSSVNPLILKQNDELLRIQATILAGIDPVSHYIRIGAGTEFADPSANILSDIALTVPYLETQD